MKLLISTLVVIAMTVPAIAAEQVNNKGTVFKSSDDSAAAQLCLAALESRDALDQKARELKMSRRTLGKVSCNDMSLVDFVKNHRNDMREWAIATVQ